MNVFDLVAVLRLDTSDYDSGLAGASQKLQDTGRMISNAGQALNSSISRPAQAAFKSIIESGSNFESAISQVAATMGTTSDAIGDIRTEALRLGSETSFSAVEAAQGFNILAQSGLNAAEQIEAMPTVLNLAAAGALSLDSAASYVTGTLKGFNFGMDRASDVADLVAKGATLANTSVGELGAALSAGAATSRNYGQTLDGTTLSLLRLAEQNVTGAEAATMLNRTMADLYTPTDKAREILDELGIAVYDESGAARDFNAVVEELNGALSGMSDEEQNAYKNTIFTTYGLQGFNKMTASSAETVDKFKDGLNDAFGSAAEQALTQLDNLQGAVTILKSAIEGLSISLSDTIIPALTNLVKYITDGVTWFNSLDDTTKKVALGFGILVAAIGPVVTVIGNVVTVIGFIGNAVTTVSGIVTTAGGVIGTVISGIATATSALFALIAAHPVILVIAAITAAVIGLGVLIYQHWDEIKAGAAAVAEWIGVKFDEAKAAIVNAWGNIKEFFSGIWDGIKSTFATVKEWFKEKFESAAEAIKTAWEAVGEFFVGVWGTISGAFASVVEFFREKFTAAKEAVISAWEGVKEFFGNVWEEIQSVFANVHEWFEEKFTQARDLATAAWESAQEKFKAVREKIQNVFETVHEWFGEKFTTAKEKAVAAWDNVKAKFETVWGNIKSAFHVEDAFQWGKDMLQNFVNGLKEKLGALRDGLVSIGNSIKDFLGFSEPEKGPLSNFHTFAPDMMELFAKGIRDNERVVTDQINKSFDFGRKTIAFGSTVSGASGGFGAAYKGGGDTYNFYSPKALDAVSAAREMKKARQQLAGGFI